MVVEMKVAVVTFDPSANGFVVLLSDLDNTRALPIWIGPFEARAISLKLENTQHPRPLTHDLIRNILGVFDSKILKIEVTDIRDNTYYALIHICSKGREITIDSRPSDAIAVALAAGVPIYVAEEVLSKATTIRLDELEEWLKSLDPEDFTYKA